MLGRLFLLFTLVPLVELYLLVTLGGLMGAGPTIALVAVTGLLGSWLARREGRKAIASYREALSKGQLPEDGIVSGLLILAGGVMLITPGILTDVFGLAMMVPPVRRSVAELVKARLQKRIEGGDIQVMQIGVGGLGGLGGSGMGGGGGRGPFVDAEIVDVDARDSSED
ncbi:FxsA family protein [Enhygromyxa salina]|uniref:Phage T7 F exclusion suppressor FxsA n=1 Tax=Enhygromyxa salina TaxID=215803 RepID=A0A2S9YBZ2_9BACT|nr:FxsA family protein [Enhygromyxa salina]PRQ02625.1 phage T7 F exclusion suppressor FxsA [Enhygromyxa salina]